MMTSVIQFKELELMQGVHDSKSDFILTTNVLLEFIRKNRFFDDTEESREKTKPTDGLSVDKGTEFQRETTYRSTSKAVKARAQPKASKGLSMSENLTSKVEFIACFIFCLFS